MSFQKYLFVVLLIAILLEFVGCSNGVSKAKRISSMLSDEEGKYYITVLGASKEIEKKFENETFQKNIKKISGFYTNENPSVLEIHELGVKVKPVFIVFGTNNELYRTNDINELNDYLESWR